MTDKEKRKVLNALYSYYTYKSLSKNVATGGGIAIYNDKGGTDYLTKRDLEKAVEIAEGTQTYFELQDEAKAQFVKKFFFEREGWISLTHEIGIAYGTVQNWRSEVIQIASKIARRNGFI
ncbi:MAG: hypothetical protein NC311_18960 [Muribaculaceae bacterium]|nr:hypothetical protein [Muribaculaceae bacterium]